MRERDKPDGWHLIVRACAMLDRLSADLFRLPELAEARAIDTLERDGEDHGDDLVCGCWGAAELATALLQLAGRHVTALIHLSSIDPGHLAPAHTLGRAVIEQGLRIQWLLEPDAATDRELRRGAFTAEEARLYRNTSGTEDFVADLEAQVRNVEVRTGQKVPGSPRVDGLADRFGPNGSLYNMYRLLSQSTHGTAVGAGPFHVDARDAWREQGGSGEWVESEFWAPALVACRDSLTGALARYRDLFAPNAALPSLDDEAEFRRTITSVPANSQEKLAAKRQLPIAGRLSSAPQNRAERRAAQRRRGR